MPSETEQLNLVVNLTDNASAGLQKLRAELGQIGAGPQSSNLKNFKEELGRIQNLAKTMGEEFERSAKGVANFFGGGQQTAQLSRFRNELNELQKSAGNLGTSFQAMGRGGREASEHVGKFKDRLEEAEKLAKSFKQEATGVIANMGLVGQTVAFAADQVLDLMGPVGAVLGGMAGGFTLVTIQAAKFGHELRQLRNVAGVLGMDPAQLKNMTEQAKIVGVSTDVIISSMHGMRAAVAELYKPGGGTTRQQLLSVATPGTERAMERFLQQLRDTHDKTQRYNLVQQTGENVYQNELRRTNDEMAARQKQSEFLAKVGVDESTIALNNIKEQSAEQQKSEDARIKRLADFAQEVTKTEQNVKQIAEEWIAVSGNIDLATIAMDKFNKHAEGGGFRPDTPGVPGEEPLGPHGHAPRHHRPSLTFEERAKNVFGPAIGEPIEDFGQPPPGTPFADRFGTFGPGVTALPPGGLTSGTQATQAPHTTGSGRGNIDYGWISGIPTDVPQQLIPEPGATFKGRFGPFGGAIPQKDLADQLGIGAIPKGKGGSRAFDLFGGDAQFFTDVGSRNIEDRRGASTASDKLMEENTGELRKLNNILALLEAGDIKVPGLGGGAAGGAGAGAGGGPAGGGPPGGAPADGSKPSDGSTPEDGSTGKGFNSPTSPAEAPEELSKAMPGTGPGGKYTLGDVQAAVLGKDASSGTVSGGDFGGKLAPKLGGKGDPRGLEGYIRQTAAKYGIDPDVAVRVAQSEGLANPVGDRGKSGGAFQLFTGGGLGNEFQKETGHSPLDPKYEKETIDFALKHAAQSGWGPWHGAKRVGIGPHQGIGGRPSTVSAADSDEAKKHGFHPTPFGTPTTPDRLQANASGGPPSEVIHGAAAMVASGANTRQLKDWMAQKGFPQHDNWCADFVSSVQVARGLKKGDLPSNFALADAWHKWGTHVTGAPEPGDVGARYAHFHGHGHLVAVEAYDQKTGMVTIMQGNPARRYNMPLKEFSQKYDIRHMDAPAREAGSGKRADLDQDRSALDRRGGGSSVNVNATGKLMADIRAPKGTNVSVEGSGLFRHVETNRQTSMSEAHRGPVPSQPAAPSGI